MRCLTVRQPWAWAIAYAGKNVENRSGNPGMWERAVGETIGIHAGSAWSTRGQKDERVRRAWNGQPDSFRGGPSLPRPERVAGHLMPIAPLGERPLWFGAVVALAELVGVHPVWTCRGECSPWAETEYTEAGGRLRADVVHLTFGEIWPMPEPVPATGRLGLWTPGQELMAELGETLVECRSQI